MKNLTSQPGSGLSLPSNVLIACLVALLIVGYGTDWKILFGHSKGPKSTAHFGATERGIRSPRMRYLRQAHAPADAPRVESASQVADSRTTAHDAAEAGENLD
ncbi:MAG TPA: hypothetical protein VGM05_09520 [Planctomycetaceae bacterium]